MRILILGAELCSAHGFASELRLQVFVRRELDGDVRQTKERWCKPRVERQYALGGIHLACRIYR